MYQKAQQASQTVPDLLLRGSRLCTEEDKLALLPKNNRTLEILSTRKKKRKKEEGSRVQLVTYLDHIIPAAKNLDPFGSHDDREDYATSFFT